MSPTIKLGQLLLLFVALCPSMQVVLPRYNYGMYFREVGKLDNTARLWRHDFMVPMPRYETFFKNLTFCNDTGDALCSKKPLTNAFVGAVNSLVKSHFDLLMENIQTMVPLLTSGMTVNSRQELKLTYPLDPIPAEKHVAAALMDDKISPLILASVKPHDFKANVWSTNVNIKMLFDYSVLLEKGVRITSENIKNLAGNVSRAMNEMTQLSFETSSFLASSSASALNAIHAIDQVSDAVVKLTKRTMSPTLLRPGDLEAAFALIANDIDYKSSRFQISERDVGYYYDLKTVRVARDADHLHAVVDMPVSMNPGNAMTLYRASAFPLAVTQNMQDGTATLLVDIPEFLAVSPDGSAYLEVSDTDLLDCSGDGVLICEHVLPSLAFNVRSCLWGLYMDDNDMVADKCELQILSHGLRPSVLELEPGYLLLTNVTNPLLDCPKQVMDARLISTCFQCVRRIPCQCSVRATHTYAPARLVDGCQADFDDKVQFPLNLLFLLKSQIAVEGINGSSMVDEEMANAVTAKVGQADLDALKEVTQPLQLNMVVKTEFPPKPAEIRYPSGLGVGGGIAVAFAVLFVVFVVFSLLKMKRLQQDVTKVGIRQEERNARASARAALPLDGSELEECLSVEPLEDPDESNTHLMNGNSV